MPIISAPQEFHEDQLFVDLRSVVGHSLFLKCEGFNFAGSIKLKAAAGMVDGAEKSGRLRAGSVLVESSSGNLGIALSMIAANRGYRFVCVTDSRCNPATRRLMETFGAEVQVITEPNEDGLLGARLAYVRERCAAEPGAVWLNQYENPDNWRAHVDTTAPAIAAEFPRLDVLFIGAGTTGTLMGCARWFRLHRPEVRIVAIDTVGSVTFGSAAAPRAIPGLGMAMRPPMLDESVVDEVLHVAEPETVAACNRLAARGFLFGGSTGTVVSGASRWLDSHDAGDLVAVTISPDLGERYLDTVYRADWVRDTYGDVSKPASAAVRRGSGDVMSTPGPVAGVEEEIEDRYEEIVRELVSARAGRTPTTPPGEVEALVTSSPGVTTPPEDVSAAITAAAVTGASPRVKLLQVENSWLRAEVERLRSASAATQPTAVPPQVRPTRAGRSPIGPDKVARQAPGRPPASAPPPTRRGASEPRTPAQQPTPVRHFAPPTRPTSAPTPGPAAPARPVGSSRTTVPLRPAPSVRAAPHPRSTSTSRSGPLMSVAESAVPSERVGAVAAGLERVLAKVLKVEQVGLDQDVFAELGADSMVMARFCTQVRERPDLPPVSIKDIYGNPTLLGLARALTPLTVSPAVHTAMPDRPRLAGRSTDAVAAMLAQVLAEVLTIERVGPEQDVFAELGADSLILAGFCTQVRKRPGLPPVALKDVYANPTMLGLARALTPSATAPTDPTIASPSPQPQQPPRPASTAAYLFCGLLQTLAFLGYALVAGVATDQAYTTISAGTTLLDVYLRSVAFGAVVFLAAALLPVLAKWILVGRWREREIRAWSLGYFRFWLVRTLIRSNPLIPLIIGTPLYPLYLRALGAKVGRNVLILTKHVPVCTDLITIGSGTVIRKDVHLTGSAAVAGTIRLGPVMLGRDVVVGEKSVLDIRTVMGDGAQLGHASALHAGQVIPAGARWHGSPAVPTQVDHRRVPADAASRARAIVYVLLQLIKIFGVYLPLVLGGLIMLLANAPQLRSSIDPGPVALNQLQLYLDALVGSAVVVFGGLLIGFVFVITLPRLLGLCVRPGKVHRVYGVQYALYRAVARLTNVKTMVGLFGDSSFIVGYLRALGYDLGRVEQTGSNFGSAVSHDNPYLSIVGPGTVVADGLTIVNADISATAFRINRVAIGARSFLGNHIAYPAGARVGDNCLLATKVMVPLGGPVRHGVGLLGSPAFEIPRSVRRDLALEVGPDEQRRLLRRKNLHNLVTLAMALLVRWVDLAGLLLIALLAVDTYPSFGFLSFGAEIVASLVYIFGLHILVERLGGGFRRRRPQSCSIYDKTFWRHERYWKLVMPLGMDKILAGTPWKNLVTRLLGAKIGRRVLDNGAVMTERTLLTIGDDVTLDEGSILQCHSQEDGAFKSDSSMLGAGASVGAGALVHYGVTVDDGAVIAPDSFLMKGQEVPAGAYWGGNPAGELSRPIRSGAPSGALISENRHDHNRPTVFHRPGVRRPVVDGCAAPTAFMRPVA